MISARYANRRAMKLVSVNLEKVMMDTYLFNVIMSFATHKPFQSLTNDIPWLVEASLKSLFEPLGVPVVDSIITGVRSDGTWTPNRKFNVSNWKRLKADLAWGNFVGLDAIWVVEKGEHVLKNQNFEVSIHSFSDSLTLIAVTLYKSIIGDISAVAWQDRWVNLGHEIFCRFGCATGYLTMDNERAANAVTPYELERHLPVPRDLTQELRGFYWGNWLSTGHIQRLGGVAAIQAEAPCFRVVQPGECEGLFLQLSPSMDDFSDTALRKLRFYFGELLPKHDQPLIWYINTTKYRLAYDGEKAGWKGKLILYDAPQ